MHKEVPAVGGRNNLLDEEIVHASANIPVCQREVQRLLHLSAELPCFPFGLTVRRRVT
jgi:hypothetical protein